MEKLTAAHRTLPFETWVEVTNLTNGKRVDVRVTDRGPFIDGRIIDLSLAAAREIDMVRAGIVPVSLRVIDPPEEPGPAAEDVTAAEAETAAQPETIAPPEMAAQPETRARYAVQAGAFTDPGRAEAFRESLPFDDARLMPREGDAALWRVVVGHNLNKDEAKELAAEVQRVSGSAFVVEDR
jgi:rare lipoprotein A